MRAHKRLGTVNYCDKISLILPNCNQIMRTATPLQFALWIVLVALWQLSSTAKAQVTTATGQTPTNYVQNTLIGQGLQVSNVTFQGNPNTQIGTFSGNNSNLGLTNGIVLSTGQINPPNGFFPNANITSAGTPGWAPLSSYYQSIYGNFANTNNAAVLTFNFVPQGDTIRFRYVFASKEYNNYVTTQFNDIFAFFLTGPNPQGGNYTNTNVALIPNTTQPVTINSVNNGQSWACSSGPCTNCQYYVDNCNQNNGHGFGGATVPMWAEARVVPCSTYTITLAIADIIDGALNSAVFLEAGSFSSNNLVLTVANNTTNASDTILTEGCGSAQLIITRTAGISQALTVNLTIGGSASNGTDYQQLPTTVNFAAGQVSDTLDIIPILDLLAEGQETITISVQGGCNTGSTGVTFYINDYQPLQVFAGNDTVIDCNGHLLVGQHSGGEPGYQFNWDNGASTSSTYFYVPTVDRYVTYTVTDTCGNTASDSLFVDFIEPVTAGFGFTGFSPSSVIEGCGTATLQITRSISVAQGKTYPIQITGTSSNGIDFQQIPNTIVFAPNQTTVTISVSPFLDGIAEGNETLIIGIVDTLCDGTLDPFSATLTIRNLDSLKVNAGPDLFIDCPRLAVGINPTVSGGWPTLNYNWTDGVTGLNRSNLLPADTTTYTIEVTDSCGQVVVDDVVVHIHHDPIADFQVNGPFCDPALVPFINLSQPGSGTLMNFQWDLDGGLTTGDANPTSVYYNGTYSATLIVTNAFNCSDTVTKPFVVLPTPQVVPTFSPQNPNMLDPLVTFIDASQPDIISRQWTIIGETSSTDSIFSYYFNRAGNYTGVLVVTNSSGCTDSIQFPIRIKDETSIYIPNAFTPNGDGLNELFTAYGVNWRTFQMWIFDRWGKELYFSNNPEKGWNGLDPTTGEVMAQGVYVYRIR
ncbi:MAG: choice-of-anchor L domain-containing protein, partial [Bacteroidetes bacterium]|nr:choice-of-anchor L domain-containing protein [Bacteroidota bacterium]